MNIETAGNEAGLEPQMSLKVKWLFWFVIFVSIIPHHTQFYYLPDSYDSENLNTYQGYIVGNSVTDGEDANERIPYAHRMALISDEYFEVPLSFLPYLKESHWQHVNSIWNVCFYVKSLEKYAFCIIWW